MAWSQYVLVTLHRPSNVDRPAQLEGIVDGLITVAGRTHVVFPVHPRTQARLQHANRLEDLEAASVRVIPPVGYLDFLSLELAAGAILTDSGGVQEEASVLGVPCFTLRPNTERPITISLGTNTLLGDDPEQIRRVAIGQGTPEPRQIPLWDGQAGERVADAIADELDSLSSAGDRVAGIGSWNNRPVRPV
jgi:UDP-N-acetylglucosamine 2-epimerase (non-hydrolysing)